jgi:hypothetical protein
MSTTDTAAAAEVIDYANLPYHPLAELFPLISGAEYEAFKADILKAGLREQMTICKDQGVVYLLEGRNRHRALKDNRHKFTAKDFVEYTGSDAVGFVVSRNIHRRHLNESQRAIIAARLITTKLGVNQHSSKGLTTADAAKLMVVSEATVKAAKKVFEKAADDVQDAVKRGKLRLGAVTTDVLKKPKAEQMKEIDRLKVEAEKEKAEKKAAEKAAKEAAKTAGQPTVPKTNQKAIELDAFKAQWRNFDEMQKRLFVEGFKDEISGWLDYINQQQALTAMTEATPLQPSDETVGS